MPSSGITAWSLTAADIGRLAMEELAVIEPGSDPDADESAGVRERLNAMLKSWQLRGVSLAGQREISVTTTAGNPLVTLPAYVRSVAGVRLAASASSERPLFPMSRTDYYALPNKATVGQPTIYYQARSAAAVQLYLWPVSAPIVTLKVDYDRIVETVTSGEETLDIREELQETVYTNLAVRIAGMFGEKVQAAPELVARAARLEQQMFDAERPDSYYLYGDCHA